MKATDIANTTESAGSYTFNPSLDTSNLATGQYTGVTATWQGASNTYSISFDVLGTFRHSQYNTPNESACTLSTSSCYLVNSTSCAYQGGALKSDFISQSWLNASGITVGTYYGYNTEQNAQFCGNNGYLPAGWSGKSFAFVPQIVPHCGSGYSISNSTVAWNFSSQTLQCGDQVLIVGLGSSPGTVKTVTDECPGCSNTQLDNYTTTPACAPGTIPDLGNFQTIRINR